MPEQLGLFLPLASAVSAALGGHTGYAASPTRTEGSMPVSASPVTFIGLSAVVSLACHLGWYGTHSGYYASLAALSCGSIVRAQVRYALDYRPVVWEMCSHHSERLTICHGCGVRPVSPYMVLHQCASCMQSDVQELSAGWEVIDA